MLFPLLFYAVSRHFCVIYQKLILGAFLGMFFVRFKVSLGGVGWGESTLGAPSEFFSCMDSLQRKAILSRGDMKGKISFLKAVFGRVLRQKIAYLGGEYDSLGRVIVVGFTPVSLLIDHA